MTCWIGTGTRARLQPAEQGLVLTTMYTYLTQGDVVVVGGCQGVDAFVGGAAFRRGAHVHVVLPSNHFLVDPHWESYATSYEQMPEGTTYRDRNLRMVEIGTPRQATVLAFPQAPQSDPRAQRSGTWQTVRLAEKAGLEVMVFGLWEGAA